MLQVPESGGASFRERCCKFQRAVVQASGGRLKEGIAGLTPHPLLVAGRGRVTGSGASPRGHIRLAGGMPCALGSDPQRAGSVAASSAGGRPRRVCRGT
jgi:hypothetical protein